MRRFLIPGLVLLLASAASAGFAANLIHSHGGIAEVVPDRTAKVREFIDYSMYPQLAPNRAVYWVIGGCDVMTLEGDFLANGKFKFTGGEAYEGNIVVKLPNMSAKVNRVVIKEVPAVGALARENGYFVQSDVKSSKKIRFGDVFHCEHYVAELDDALFKTAVTAEEREAIARAALAPKLRSLRP